MRKLLWLFSANRSVHPKGLRVLQIPPKSNETPEGTVPSCILTWSPVLFRLLGSRILPPLVQPQYSQV